jgi:hypothetical protein
MTLFLIVCLIVFFLEPSQLLTIDLINDDQFTSSNVKTEEISKNIIWNK